MRPMAFGNSQRDGVRVSNYTRKFRKRLLGTRRRRDLSIKPISPRKLLVLNRARFATSIQHGAQKSDRLRDLPATRALPSLRPEPLSFGGVDHLRSRRFGVSRGVAHKNWKLLYPERSGAPVAETLNCRHSHLPTW